jgi:hypothetical protein
MDEADDKPQESLWKIRNARSLWLSISVVIAGSGLIVFAGHSWGVANDCIAQGITQDGQCGLATGMGNLFGVGGGGIFLLVGLIAVWILWNRSKVE